MQKCENSDMALIVFARNSWISLVFSCNVLFMQNTKLLFCFLPIIAKKKCWLELLNFDMSMNSVNWLLFCVKKTTLLCRTIFSKVLKYILNNFWLYDLFFFFLKLICYLSIWFIGNKALLNYPSLQGIKIVHVSIFITPKKIVFTSTRLTRLTRALYLNN